MIPPRAARQAPVPHNPAPAATLIPAPLSPQIKLALCQLSITDDRQKNIQTALAAVREAAAAGADVVMLPEMWNCPYSNASFPTFAEDVSSGFAPSYTAMSEAAARSSVVLVGGSIPERVGASLYNTCFIFGKAGQLLGRHRKLHLFDIDIPGQITFKESETLTPGDLPTVVDTEAGRIGVGICYDIRFPELAGIMAARGAQLLLYPGAFNMTTGPAHWELLQRARAVDNQLFVAMCSPARDESGSYVAWGHSTVVSPFGEVLATTGERAGVVVAELDLGEVETRRANMPMRAQKRGDLYALLDLARDQKPAK